jgi:hypothetical protein
VVELDEKDLQLRFDGPPIRKIGGAPADAVVSALNALQRIVHLIGMRDEGRILKQRAKPSTKVRQEYAVICRPSIAGSHIQPFDVASYAGISTAAALSARQNLLEMLRAFNSEDAETVQRVIPNARERWFIAEAASGLVPNPESGIQVTIRKGSHGPFDFKADKAGPLIERFRSGSPPDSTTRRITGRIIAIDFDKYIISLRPIGSRVFKLRYPADTEIMMQVNRRRRIGVVGVPERTSTGDVSGFLQINRISELEPHLEDIGSFKYDNREFVAIKSLRITVTYEFEDRLFVFQDSSIGVDVYVDRYEDIREAVLEELVFLWRNYAIADDKELDAGARKVKNELLNRFREADYAEE